jgi:CubicO group peptidase (beta-lactamase class C family)
MNFRASAFGLCFGLWLVGCSDSNVDTPKEPEPEPPGDLALELRGSLDDAFEDGFSGSVRVSAEGEVLLSEGRGFADREREIANGEHTAFDVGSIMKSFTAVALFKLEEDGALSLDDPLSALLPDVPEDKQAITLREIVQHRAGFDEYHDTTGDFEPMTRLEARERILAQELLFSPGEDQEYSNSGYTLLADIIETVSGRPYTEYVRTELFARAGMLETGFYSEPLWQTVETAIGYEASTFGDNDPATWPYTWALVGNGGLVSTVLDLDRWVTAFWGGEIVSAETFERIEEEYLAEGAGGDEEEPIFGEAGAGDYGLGGVLIYAPGPDLRVFIGTNTYDSFDVEEFAVDLAETVLAAQDEEP